jgi:hypothetical protein
MLILLPRALAALTTATVIGTGLTAGPAVAASSTWTAPSTLVAAAPSSTQPAQTVPDPAGGVLLYYSANGVPAVRHVSAAGALGPQLNVPPYSKLGDVGNLGTVAFLADGAAIVSWQLEPYGTDYMAYLSPTGKWGAPVPAVGTTVAVRKGEVVTAEPGGTGITADDWSLSSSGVLTHTAGPTTVFTGDPLFGTADLALDANGSAVVVTMASTVANGDEEVYAVTRSTGGTWSTTPQNLSNQSEQVARVSFAAAPGGRAVVAWESEPTTSPADIEEPSAFAAVHGTTGGFGSAVALASINTSAQSYRSDILPITAAGTDGTLAIGITAETGNGEYEGDYSIANTIRTVSKSSTTIGGAKAVTGTPGTFAFTALGVGAGEVAGGMLESVYGAAKGTGPAPSSYNASEATTTVVVPASGTQTAKNLGAVSGRYDGNGSEPCPSCDGSSPPSASVTAVAIDKFGTVVAAGQLIPGGGLAWAHRLGSVPATPVVKITATTAKATKKFVPLTLRCSTAACKGAAALGRTGAKKFVPLASVAYSIRAGRAKTVLLKLTAAGKKAFKHASAKHPVKVTAYASVTSGKIASKALKVT